MRSPSLTAFCALLGIAPWVGAVEEVPRAGCAAEARQFDFWVGRWNVSEKGKPAGVNHDRTHPRRMRAARELGRRQGRDGQEPEFLRPRRRPVAPDLDRWLGRRAVPRRPLRKRRHAHAGRAARQRRNSADAPSHHLDAARRWKAAPGVGVDTHWQGRLDRGVRRPVRAGELARRHSGRATRNRNP